MLVASESSYSLGEGYKIPSVPLYVGGYFSTDYAYKVDQKQNIYTLDDLAFLAYGSVDKLSYLAEFEFKKFYVKEWGDQTHHEDNTHMLAERLYASYDIDDNYAIKAGKYNSPIGFWNLTPINVLRDTSSSPMSTSIIFPKYTTGLDVEYRSFEDCELKIDLLAQNNKDLDYKYNNFEIDAHYGAGIEYTQNALSLKLNGGYFHSRNPILHHENIYYTLASLKLEYESFQIMSEVGTQFNKDESIAPYASYLQGLYRLDEKNGAILRVESYKKYEELSQVKSQIKDNIAIFGYVYRPLYPVALKAEYQFHSLHSENQALFSFSVLF